MMGQIFLSGIAILLGLIVLERLLRPKPIPGIPHRPQAIKSILGDLPDVYRWSQETGEVASYIYRKAAKDIGSPIFQIWIRPFARPWVVVTDFREAQDIITRRTREFDRSSFFRDIFYELVPGSMVHMGTNDTWRAQRKRVGDTMTPAFLENVSAPSIYASAQALIDLWREKARLAKGHPFSAKEDLYRSGLDTIWAVTFGTQIGATRGQIVVLSQMPAVPLTQAVDDEITFPVAEEPDAYKSILILAESLEIPVQSPIPRIMHWLALTLLPSYIRATGHKNKLIDRQIDEAVEKFSAHDAAEDKVDCALDHVIHREVQLAIKESRVPDLKSMYMKDELFAFMVGGHDTSASTLSWGLKLLTDSQDAQKKLRTCLSAAFNGVMPQVKDITKARIPYLDATLEEIYRLSGTSTAIFRRTTTDVVVLGHVVPKNTDVCLVTYGPDFLDPAVPVDETKRSASSREAKGKCGSWNPSNMREFMPDRWLSNTGEFNPQAGPSMLFGGGMRGCFGRRLAELQIRILLTMIIWNFQLEPTPTELSTFKSKDGITRAPRQCYLRLVEIR